MTVAVTEEATFVVVIENSGELLAPAGTVTVAGGMIAGSELAKATTTPAAPAGPSKVTRQVVAEDPDETELGEMVMAVSTGGRTVSTPVRVTPPKLAEMLTGVVTATSVVVMVNTADAVWPAGTVTEAGTTAAGLLLISGTTTPPAGAGAERVTRFEVADTCPTTAAGLIEMDDRATGVTIKLAVLVTPL